MLQHNEIPGNLFNLNLFKKRIHWIKKKCKRLNSFLLLRFFINRRFFSAILERLSKNIIKFFFHWSKTIREIRCELMIIAIGQSNLDWFLDSFELKINNSRIRFPKKSLLNRHFLWQYRSRMLWDLKRCWLAWRAHLFVRILELFALHTFLVPID